MKEQRVFKNNGKLFEENLRESFGKHIWTYRPPDTGGGMMARFTQESLCDVIAYNTENKNLVLLELKSTLGTSINVRPYEQCMEYEKIKKDFDEWNTKQTAETRKPIKDEIKKQKKQIKELYKATNQAMIKYHQLRDLLEIKEDYNIESYLVFTFFKTVNTYAVPITNFIEDFWKVTDKKSINEKDLNKLIEANKAYKVPQEYIRRTMNSFYEVDFLTTI